MVVSNSYLNLMSVLVIARIGGQHTASVEVKLVMNKLPRLGPKATMLMFEAKVEDGDALDFEARERVLRVLVS